MASTINDLALAAFEARTVWIQTENHESKCFISINEIPDGLYYSLAD
jgi:hypothetical protein